MTATDLQAAVDHVLRLRGVETPCETCHGLGTKRYPDSGTWRPKVGIVLRAFTHDVCDTCWGSGDAHRHGVNLREQEATFNARVAERALSLFADKAGVGLGTIRPAALAVANELDGLSRMKNKVRVPWFSLVCEQVAKALREGVDAAKEKA